ncbi:MAG: hypothetical protein EXR51_06935 [Dehalococcoidia bacterium]|nr:hypothetical protein [Dehalococcoidia bacterium]
MPEVRHRPPLLRGERPEDVDTGKVGGVGLAEGRNLGGGTSGPEPVRDRSDVRGFHGGLPSVNNTHGVAPVWNS